MSDFGDQVEYAGKPLPTAWRLVVFDVPDRLGGLLSRHGFRPTKKNPAHWWRLFDPARPADKEFAERVRADVLAAGLKGKWARVTLAAQPRKPLRPVMKKFKKHARPANREGFGGALNARPIAGTWRRKTRHR